MKYNCCTYEKNNFTFLFEYINKSILSLLAYNFSLPGVCRINVEIKFPISGKCESQFIYNT